MNKYLEKIAEFEKIGLRRIIGELAKGNVSMKLEELVRKGFVKPQKVYAAGMRKGNDVLAKKTNSIIRNPTSEYDKAVSSSGGGYAMNAKQYGGNRISFDKNFPISSNKVEHQGFLRHELFEAMEANSKRGISSNRVRKKIDTSPKALIGYGYSPRSSEKISKTLSKNISLKPTLFHSEMNGAKVLTGAHLSPRVLTRESEMVRTNPHLSNKFKDIRDTTGESRIVEKITGKKYGVDKMTGKDHKIADSARPDSYESLYGSKLKSFQSSTPKSFLEMLKNQYGK
jgi:hypothetical protein